MVSQLIEPAVKWYGEFLKVPTDEVATDIVGMGGGSALSLLNNFLFGGVGAKLVSFGEGILSHVIAGRVTTGRDSKDLTRMGDWLMWTLLDPKPEDLVNLANIIAELKAGIQFGNWGGLARVFGVKTPAEIMAELDNISRAFGRAFGAPVPSGRPSAPSLPSPAPILEQLKQVPSTPPTLNGAGAFTRSPDQPAIF